MCTSQLTSVLFISLKLEVYFFGEEFVTIFIALFFLSKLSRNSFFSRIAESHLRSNLSCQRQWKNCIEMRLVAPVTDQRLFFSLGASRRERSVSIRKKYPLEPRVGTPTVTLSWISTNLVLNSYVIGYVTPIQLTVWQTINFIQVFCLGFIYLFWNYLFQFYSEIRCIARYS